jgi:hypothetical protein
MEFICAFNTINILFIIPAFARPKIDRHER